MDTFLESKNILFTYCRDCTGFHQCQQGFLFKLESNLSFRCKRKHAKTESREYISFPLRRKEDSNT